jgi:hypothetical protein
MSYSYNNVPIIPGAYLVNGQNNTTNELYHLPIFGSISRVEKINNEEEGLSEEIEPSEIYRSIKIF